MRFWDTSAIVPLLVTEAATAAMTTELERDSALIVWWGTEVECVSALARLERTGDLDSRALAAAIARLSPLTDAWREVEPIARVRQVATRLVRVHALRAADALQLAAAIVAAENDPPR